MEFRRVFRSVRWVYGDTQGIIFTLSDDRSSRPSRDRDRLPSESNAGPRDSSHEQSPPHPSQKTSTRANLDITPTPQKPLTQNRILPKKPGPSMMWCVPIVRTSMHCCKTVGRCFMPTAIRGLCSDGRRNGSAAILWCVAFVYCYWSGLLRNARQMLQFATNKILASDF